MPFGSSAVDNKRVNSLFMLAERALEPWLQQKKYKLYVYICRS